MSADHRAAQAVASLHALHAHTVPERLHQLAEAADSAVNAVAALRSDLTAERAERLAHHFGGMQRTAAALAVTLDREAKQA